jgi:hypothetical protein
MIHIQIEETRDEWRGTVTGFVPATNRTRQRFLTEAYALARSTGKPLREVLALKLREAERAALDASQSRTLQSRWDDCEQRGREMLRILDCITRTVKKAIDSGDISLCEVNGPVALAQPQQARLCVKTIVPHVVCLRCGGAGCDLCLHRGLLSRFRFEKLESQAVA